MPTHKWSETELENHLESLLDAKGIFHIKGISRGLKGFPDRQIFAHKIFYVEVKLGKELGSYYKQTKMQKWWQKTIEASNGNYVLLTGIKEVEDFVNGLS